MKYRILQTKTDFYVIQRKRKIFAFWEFVDTYTTFEEAKERIEKMKQSEIKQKESQKIIKTWKF